MLADREVDRPLTRNPEVSREGQRPCCASTRGPPGSNFRVRGHAGFDAIAPERSEIDRPIGIKTPRRALAQCWLDGLSPHA